MRSLTPILHTRAVSRSYRRGLYGHETTYTVLRNLNLDIYAGERAAIVGERGTGKTTLLYCLAGMLTPSAGTIHWNLPHDGDRPDIAYLPEKAAYYGFLTCAEVLEYYVAGKHLTTAERRARIAEALDRVSLTSLAQMRVGELGRDMLLRLRLAQALVGAPRVILVDDLITPFDASQCRCLLGLFERLTSAGLTLIMTTHNRKAAAELATRIIPMGRHPRQQGAVIDPHPLSSRIALPMS